MTKFDVWFKVYEEYCVTLEADNLEQIIDMIHDNPESDFLDRSWVDGGVELTHYQESIMEEVND